MKKYKWYKMSDAAATAIAEKSIVSLAFGSKTICITRYQNKLYGCAQKCPHASGQMNQGWIDEQGNIVCPLHRYKFSLQNGRNTSGEGYYLKTYPIEERPDGIYVGIEASLLGW